MPSYCVHRTFKRIIDLHLAVENPRNITLRGGGLTTLLKEKIYIVISAPLHGLKRELSEDNV